MRSNRKKQLLAISDGASAVSGVTPKDRKRLKDKRNSAMDVSPSRSTNGNVVGQKVPRAIGGSTTAGVVQTLLN